MASAKLQQAVERLLNAVSAGNPCPLPQLFAPLLSVNKTAANAGQTKLWEARTATAAARLAWLVIHAAVLPVLLACNTDLRAALRGTVSRFSAGTRQPQDWYYAAAYGGLLFVNAALFASLAGSDPGFIKPDKAPKRAIQAAKHALSNSLISISAVASGMEVTREPSAQVDLQDNARRGARKSSDAEERCRLLLSSASGEFCQKADSAHSTKGTSGALPPQPLDAKLPSHPRPPLEPSGSPISPTTAAEPLPWWYEGPAPGRSCEMCSAWQPVRARHCRVCGRCVLRHDHHCAWLGTCVGRQNHARFWWFLVTQTCCILWSLDIALSGFRRHSLADYLDGTGRAGGLVPLVAALGGLLGLLAFSGGMLLYHTYLAMTNQTTYEHTRRHKVQYLQHVPNGVHPFSRGGVMQNLAGFCGIGALLGNLEVDTLPPPAELLHRAKALTLPSWLDNDYYSCC